MERHHLIECLVLSPKRWTLNVVIIQVLLSGGSVGWIESRKALKIRIIYLVGVFKAVGRCLLLVQLTFADVVCI